MERTASLRSPPQLLPIKYACGRPAKEFKITSTTMKLLSARLSFLICVCLMAMSGHGQAIIADGTGIFRIVVVVQDAITHERVEGATVFVEMSERTKAAAAQDFKALLKLFDPTTTNAAGDALVYRFGGWSSSDGNENQSLYGVLKVKKKGYADYSIELSKLFKGAGVTTKIDGKVPEVFVELTKAK